MNIKNTILSGYNRFIKNMMSRKFTVIDFIILAVFVSRAYHYYNITDYYYNGLHFIDLLAIFIYSYRINALISMSIKEITSKKSAMLKLSFAVIFLLIIIAAMYYSNYVPKYITFIAFIFMVPVILWTGTTIRNLIAYKKSI